MKIIFNILCLFICCTGYSQKFEYRKVPNFILEKRSSVQKIPVQNQEEFIDITKFLPKSYVTDGTVDYTNNLQDAINKNRKILMPNFPLLINDKSLSIPSNTTIFFQPKSELIMNPSKKGDDSRNHYYALTLNNVNNVSLLNCNIRGDRDSHLGQKGEWGMGIGILGSTNISIMGGKITNCWGDGIYISNIKQWSSTFTGYHKPSSSVVIRNVFIDNNRRNGISITSGVDIEIKNCIVANTNGTLPMSGIDVEPNTYLDLIKDIKLHNITTFNNNRDGILLVLTKIASNKKVQDISIDVDGHIDIGSYSPLRIGSGFRRGDKKMTGGINIRNTRWTENEVGVRYNRGNNLLPTVQFQNNIFHQFKGNIKRSDDKYLNTTRMKDIF